MNPSIIPSLVACASLLSLAACSDEVPQPPPVAQPLAQPAPQAAPQPEPQTVAAARQSAPDADAELAARVKKALESAATEIAQGIDVSAKQGVVTLFGTVASAAERGKAEKIAVAVSGVNSVENQLAVVKGS